MPVTTWEEIAGYACSSCGKPATHFYGMAIPEHAVCCDCHTGSFGGGLYTAKEAADAHARVLLRRAQEGGE
jgi:hypothetical protein